MLSARSLASSTGSSGAGSAARNMAVCCCSEAANHSSDTSVLLARISCVVRARVSTPSQPSHCLVKHGILFTCQLEWHHLVAFGGGLKARAFPPSRVSPPAPLSLSLSRCLHGSSPASGACTAATRPSLRSVRRPHSTTVFCPSPPRSTSAGPTRSHTRHSAPTAPPRSSTPRSTPAPLSAPQAPSVGGQWANAHTHSVSGGG